MKMPAAEPFDKALPAEEASFPSPLPTQIVSTDE